MRKDIYVPNVDMDILKLQHEDLIEKIWNDADSILWGVVELMDYILDEYYFPYVEESLVIDVEG